MTQNNLKAIAAFTVFVFLVAGVNAQEKPKPPARSGDNAPVRVQVVLVRYDGEKKISSMPYTLIVNPGGKRTRLGMGVQVPVQVVANNTVTVLFKDVGTDISCGAETIEGDGFRIDLFVKQSALYVAEGSGTTSAERLSVNGNPMLRSFDSEVVFVLRDGETKQLSTSTDPVNGQTLKVDVTLNVIK